MKSEQQIAEKIDDEIIERTAPPGKIVSSFYSVAAGDVSFGRWLLNFFLPTLLGNSVGGVAVVAMVAHAEFVRELD